MGLTLSHQMLKVHHKGNKLPWGIDCSYSLFLASFFPILSEQSSLAKTVWKYRILYLHLYVLFKNNPLKEMSFTRYIFFKHFQFSDMPCLGMVRYTVQRLQSPLLRGRMNSDRLPGVWGVCSGSTRSAPQTGRGSLRRRGGRGRGQTGQLGMILGRSSRILPDDGTAPMKRG